MAPRTLLAGLVVLALVAAVAQAQCSVTAGGKYFDLSKANNGAYVPRPATPRGTLSACGAADAQVCGGAIISALSFHSDVEVIMTTDYKSVMNSCKPISSADGSICQSTSMACQKYRSNNLSFKMMANKIATSPAPSYGTRPGERMRAKDL